MNVKVTNIYLAASIMCHILKKITITSNSWMGEHCPIKCMSFLCEEADMVLIMQWGFLKFCDL
jgi:hypothetical protein